MAPKETPSASIESFATRKSETSLKFALFNLFYTLMVDVILYAVVVPLAAAYLSGACAKTFEWSPKHELLLIIALTFSMVYGAFCIFGEAVYWKHLFEVDSIYDSLLKIRDGVNAIIAIMSIACIASTVELMVCDKSMKPMHWSEGTGYFFVKTFLGWLHMDRAIEPHLGLRLPHRGSIMDPDFGENGRYEHAAAYMFYWAVLSSSVAKLLYFNTLFTLVNAMKIFVALNPSFGDDDPEEEITCPCSDACSFPESHTKKRNDGISI